MSQQIAENLANGRTPFAIDTIRSDFPVLAREVRGKPLAYLDNAATTQKPLPVIEAIDTYYREYNSNIHRGVHTLSERATAAYENARTTVRRFINAGNDKEIIFVRGATEGINLIAQSYGRANLQAGDEIIISEMEHHSNIVPWQMLCQQTGAVLKVIPIDENGDLILSEYEKLLGPKTRIVSIVHISNALGTINPVRQVIERAHEYNAVVVVDGAQATPHAAVDVQALDCDFYVFSGHKLFGPTGIGVLYGKQDLLESMPPYQGGGDMIKVVTLEKTEYNELPHKFEAGTPHIAGVIGLGKAVEYIQAVGLEAIVAYEHELLDYASLAVLEVPGLNLIGTAVQKTSILSFTLDTIHPHDIGTILDNDGIAIRAGHHCAMPVMQHFRVPATARASLAFYNTRTEIDRLVKSLHKCREMFS
ncbi:MAG TPA: cysteine desulfurase [Gammaproteobacteria bacterium]|nr:cysteine desulfurase [Gammaproteobacteria bacterium]